MYDRLSESGESPEDDTKRLRLDMTKYPDLEAQYGRRGSIGLLMESRQVKHGDALERTDILYLQPCLGVVSRRFGKEGYFVLTTVLRGSQQTLRKGRKLLCLQPFFGVVSTTPEGSRAAASDIRPVTTWHCTGAELFAESKIRQCDAWWREEPPQQQCF